MTLRMRSANAFQHDVAGTMAIGVVDPFEMIDVEDHQGERPAAIGRIGDERGKMGLEIAAVVDAGQRIDDGEFDRGLDIVAQRIDIALAAHLRAHPRQAARCRRSAAGENH